MLPRLKRHLVKCLVAGIVAILPIGGLIFSVAYFEQQVAGSWLKAQGFYFFGLGLILLIATVYVIGLLVSSIVGRWLFNRVDRLMDNLPILGNLYQTLKQIVGYGEGPQGLFKRVVWVASDQANRHELGLVTAEASEATAGRIGVFLPAGPSPTTGRLLYLDPKCVTPASMTVSEALQVIVSLGGVGPDTGLFAESFGQVRS